MKRISIILLAISTMAIGQTIDKISTLALDQTLYTRGTLGGVTVDQLGFIYVANFQDAVWKISPSGKVDLLTSGLYGSSGNTIHPNGDLFQGNFLNNSIYKIDRMGNVTVYIEKGLDGPVGMVFDDSLNLYVCNCKGNSISKVTPKKEVRIYSHELFNCPNGITRDSEGNFFIVNFGNDHVLKMDRDGTVKKFVTIPGPEGNAHIVFHNNNFYLTKIKNNSLYKLTITGKFEALIGPTLNQDIDGPLAEASLARPNGIGVDPKTGDIYLNTLQGNWRSAQDSEMAVRKVSLAKLTDILTYQLDNNDTDATIKAFWDYCNDPMNSHEDVGPPTGQLAWRYMSNRKINEAITLFSLMSEKYPSQWRPWYYLGEVYKIIGQPEKALDFYQKAIKLDPANNLIQSKINEIQENE